MLPGTTLSSWNICLLHNKSQSGSRLVPDAASRLIWRQYKIWFCVSSPGKAFEITYIRLKFYTSRPDSFAIYKRTEQDGQWLPYQYYSSTCRRTYGKDLKTFIRPGDDEQTALCTDEFSDISPLTGGNVAFSTLEGRPSAYNYDQSLVLQVRLHFFMFFALCDPEILNIKKTLRIHRNHMQSETAKLVSAVALNFIRKQVFSWVWWKQEVVAAHCY